MADGCSEAVANAHYVTRAAGGRGAVRETVELILRAQQTWQQVVDQLVRYPNVYTDTAGVRRFDYIVQAVKRAGPHKILFGSDGPWLHPGVEIHKIRLLGLPPEKEALILGGNVLRLMRHARVGWEAAQASPPVNHGHARPGVYQVDGGRNPAYALDGRLPPGAQPEYEL